MTVAEGDLTALWWHLWDDHGLSAEQTHGDPQLMHAASHAHGAPSHTHDKA